MACCEGSFNVVDHEPPPPSQSWSMPFAVPALFLGLTNPEMRGLETILQEALVSGTVKSNLQITSHD